MDNSQQTIESGRRSRQQGCFVSAAASYLFDLIFVQIDSFLRLTQLSIQFLDLISGVAALLSNALNLLSLSSLRCIVGLLSCELGFQLSELTFGTSNHERAGCDLVEF